MLCCMRRTKQVEKQEDTDQKIEQDGNKPEDTAHKAATKIQASFRGHIIRKKMKGDQSDSDIKANGEAVENKDAENEECKANGTEEAPCNASETQEEQKKEDTTAVEAKTPEEKPAADAASPEAAKPTPPSEEKLPESSTEKGSNESLLAPEPKTAPSSEECKETDVPAAKDASTGKDQEKAATSPTEAKKSETANSDKPQMKKSVSGRFSQLFSRKK
ncbi:neuromodulin isoform X3 [Pleurodeles waltl]|uniref:neuromodulin isoform X3 n=1 Tax=Pleurodeles waltl TaxID=8319 RepID=UPI0037096451